MEAPGPALGCIPPCFSIATFSYFESILEPGLLFISYVCKHQSSITQIVRATDRDLWTGPAWRGLYAKKTSSKDRILFNFIIPSFSFFLLKKVAASPILSVQRYHLFYSSTLILDILFSTQEYQCRALDRYSTDWASCIKCRLCMCSPASLKGPRASYRLLRFRKRAGQIHYLDNIFSLFLYRSISRRLALIINVHHCINSSVRNIGL